VILRHRYEYVGNPQEDERPTELLPVYSVGIRRRFAYIFFGYFALTPVAVRLGAEDPQPARLNINTNANPPKPKPCFMVLFTPLSICCWEITARDDK
jgi:hypothetical protein